MGLMAQDVMSFGKYVKAHLGIRYSRLNGSTKNDVATWNPSFGLIVSPLENVNVFGSYTTTTSLRSANNVLQTGGTVYRLKQHNGKQELNRTGLMRS